MCPIWGVALLGERFSIPGVGGILLVIVGTFLVQMQRITFAEMSRPFRDLSSPSVRAALLAGFIYSIGSIAEKTGVRHYSPLYFTYFLVLSMLLLMSINLARTEVPSAHHSRVPRKLATDPLQRPRVMTSFLTFRYGLNLAPVSYAVPVRQVSILVGVVIGILFLRESCGRIQVTIGPVHFSRRCTYPVWIVRRPEVSPPAPQVAPGPVLPPRSPDIWRESPYTISGHVPGYSVSPQTGLFQRAPCSYRPHSLDASRLANTIVSTMKYLIYPSLNVYRSTTYPSTHLRPSLSFNSSRFLIKKDPPDLSGGRFSDNLPLSRSELFLPNGGTSSPTLKWNSPQASCYLTICAACLRSYHRPCQKTRSRYR